MKNAWGRPRASALFGPIALFPVEAAAEDTEAAGSTVAAEAPLVSAKMGDPAYARDLMRVTNSDNGQVLLSNATTAAGQVAEMTFIVLVTDGSMDLTFSDPGGNLSADGVTADPITACKLRWKGLSRRRRPAPWPIGSRL